MRQNNYIHQIFENVGFIGTDKKEHSSLGSWLNSEAASSLVLFKTTILKSSWREMRPVLDDANLEGK